MTADRRGRRRQVEVLERWGGGGSGRVASPSEKRTEQDMEQAGPAAVHEKVSQAAPERLAVDQDTTALKLAGGQVEEAAQARFADADADAARSWRLSPSKYVGDET
jgi:hypothetical protein